MFAQHTDPSPPAVDGVNGLWIFRLILEEIGWDVLGLFKIATYALRSRRQRFLQLAAVVLREDELECARSGHPGLLDRSADWICAQLERKTVIPPALDCCHGSPYHIRFIKNQALEERVVHALDISQCLYAAGFVDVDVPDRSGHTPLFQNIKDYNKKNQNDGQWLICMDLATWFITRGAEAVNKNPEGWPNIVYYLALALPERRFGTVGSVNEDLRALSSDAKLHISTDGCDCFCSTAGCLPSRLIFRGQRVSDPSVAGRLNQWFNTWKWIQLAKK
ncbi:uncharacterized protein BDZ83DRAFT_277453 [Colletotrichum acutatum]|uniref:Uncharacterized protein n=1 Tax=Glomerella acutata TaxID=27357 RepID=A0AAD8XFF1_GLOAC|nr:uncharacterized protein BDZ83DRAFT_277453 [Colletotrichum acutatum]KAK1725834.1 hypothetical protein BDZ83DRAFT_277453 [Colletotrichum acutatum]